MLMLENKTCLLVQRQFSFVCRILKYSFVFHLGTGKHLFKISLEGHPILQCAVSQIFGATDVERYSMVFSFLQVDVVWQYFPSFSFLTFYQE